MISLKFSLKVKLVAMIGVTVRMKLVAVWMVEVKGSSMSLILTTILKKMCLN